MDSAFARKDNPPTKDTLSGVRFFMATRNQLIEQVYAEMGNGPGQLFQEIIYLLGLKKGGIIRDGQKWIWKKQSELAKRFNRDERTIRRHLKALVETGWLKRAKHKVQSHRDHIYFYAIGELAHGQSISVDETLSEKTKNGLARQFTGMQGAGRNANWFGLGDEPKARLETAELAPLQTVEDVPSEPDISTAPIKGTQHDSQHGSHHGADADAPTQRRKPKNPIKRIQQLAAHKTGQATPMPEPLDPELIRTLAAEARANTPLLQRSAAGFG